MTITSAIVAALNANAPLTAVLVGGIYAEDEVGRNGISEASVAEAYLSGKLQPCAIVQERIQSNWGGGHDPAWQYNTRRAMVEVRLYRDSESTYAALETAGRLVKKVLDQKLISGLGFVREMGKYNDRQPNMQNALLIQYDFQVVYGEQLYDPDVDV